MKCVPNFRRQTSCVDVILGTAGSLTTARESVENWTIWCTELCGRSGLNGPRWTCFCGTQISDGRMVHPVVSTGLPLKDEQIVSRTPVCVLQNFANWWRSKYVTGGCFLDDEMKRLIVSKRCCQLRILLSYRGTSLDVKSFRLNPIHYFLPLQKPVLYIYIYIIYIVIYFHCQKSPEELGRDRKPL